MKYKIEYVKFKQRQCTCGVHLKEEGKDVTRKINKFTDENGLHIIGKKAAICFDCNYCDSTFYQVYTLESES